jgi:hypothetical protein
VLAMPAGRRAFLLAAVEVEAEEERAAAQPR